MKSLLIAGLLTALSINIATADTVRMGTEGAYPPYNFINDKKEVDGFERHLGDELCKRANLTCVWVVNEWDSIIPNLLAGNYDTIIAGTFPENANFKLIFNIAHLKLIAGDYNVSVSSKLVSRFDHAVDNISYWIALEKSSDWSG